MSRRPENNTKTANSNCCFVVATSSHSVLSNSKSELDVSNHGEWKSCWTITLDRLSISTNQELLEIPNQVTLTNWRPVHRFGVTDRLDRVGTRGLKESEERVFIGTIHIPLGHQLKVWHKSAARAHVLDTVEDLRVLGGFLETEVVGGEPQDHKVWVVHLLD